MKTFLLLCTICSLVFAGDENPFNRDVSFPKAWEGPIKRLMMNISEASEFKTLSSLRMSQSYLEQATKLIVDAGDEDNQLKSGEELELARELKKLNFDFQKDLTALKKNNKSLEDSDSYLISKELLTIKNTRTSLILQSFYEPLSVCKKAGLDLAVSFFVGVGVGLDYVRCVSSNGVIRQGIGGELSTGAGLYLGATFNTDQSCKEKEIEVFEGNYLMNVMKGIWFVSQNKRGFKEPITGVGLGAGGQVNLGGEGSLLFIKRKSSQRTQDYLYTLFKTPSQAYKSLGLHFAQLEKQSGTNCDIYEKIANTDDRVHGKTYESRGVATSKSQARSSVSNN